jgi:hypothetical protein
MKKPRITDKTVAAKKAAFLRVFMDTASITRACEIVGMNRERHYTWLEKDPDYKARFAVAVDRAADRLEDEGVRRAKRGTEKWVMYKGQPCYDVKRDANGEPIRDKDGRFELDMRKPLVIREYSDVLLMFMLKGLRPDKYRDNWKGEITGPGGGPLQVTDPRLASLSDDELHQLHSIAQKFASVGSDRSGDPAPPAK